jgi:outer membrane protein assembly factor BamB
MPLVADGGLYVVDTRGNAVAIDLETGRKRWSIAFPSDVSGTPLIAGGLLIAPADDGVVRALSLETGETVWTTALGVGVASSVGGSGELALIGAEDGALHALDTATGEGRWSVEVGEPIVKAPAIADGMAYVVSGGDAVAVDVSTGEIAWRLDGLTTDGFATPVSHDGVLYLAHRPAGIGVPGEIIALDVSDAGESDPIERWRWQAPTTGEMSVGAAGPGAVYAISADGKVYRIDPATGIGEPYLTTGAQIGSPISLVGETLYVGSQDGRVYAVDRSSGSVLWSREAGGSALGPVAADGRLIVSTEMGRLVSLVEAPHASPR